MKTLIFSLMALAICFADLSAKDSNCKKVNNSLVELVAKSNSSLTSPTNVSKNSIFIADENHSIDSYVPIPLLVSPKDGETGVDYKPTLQWDTIPNARGYIFEVSTSWSFESDFRVKLAFEEHFYMQIGLNYSTVYYWRVKAINTDNDTGNWSLIWKFKTIGVPLAAPTLNSPPKDTVNVYLQPTFYWSAVANATNYIFELANSSDFSTKGYLLQKEVYATSYTPPTKLNENTVYYWRVNAHNGANKTSAWSQVWSFSTRGTPMKPVLISPPQSAKCVDTVVNLYWDTAGFTSGYQCQFSPDSTFASSKSFFLTSTSVLIDSLNYDTKYYWRARGYNPYKDTSAWSSVFSFSTKEDSPVKPILYYPCNNQTNVADNVKLIWIKAKNADTYRYELSESNTLNNLFFSGFTEDNDVITPSIASKRKMYWRVKSCNECDTSDWSSIYSFTMGTTRVDYSAESVETTLAPNPAQDEILVMRNGEAANIKIFSISGANVLEGKTNDKIDIKGLNTGLYYFQLDNKTYSFVKY